MRSKVFQWTRISVERRKEVLLQQLDLSGLDGWTEANQVATHALLADYHDIFSLDPGELGCTNLAKHEIRIVDDEPLKEQFWSIPAPLVDEVWAHVKEMLEVGTICQRQSPWCNAVVLVNKKEGGLHFCIDFCNLNAQNQERLLSASWDTGSHWKPSGSRILLLLGLEGGFWQIAIDEVSKQYTAFIVGNLGFFECECMPFGPCNATAIFQRLMQNCQGELNLMYSLMYLDNVMVFSKVEEEHVECLHVVFDCFQEHNLKLKPTKCEFFWNKINYLVHHVSKLGVRPSKENLKAVAEFTPPQTCMEIQAFLGLFGYYRQFIKGIAHIAQPLHEYIWGRCP